MLLLLLSGASFAKTNTIYVHQDQPKFTIKLESNRTTGYSWSLKNYDHKLLSLESHTYIPPHTSLIGAPGNEQWIFQASPHFFKNSKTTKISLSYARPWEHGKSLKTVEYEVIPKKLN